MKLISGSFRGFPFSILDHSIDGENFTSNHDFINSRVNLVENYGPQAKKFSLTVIVKGETIEDYHETRDGFIAVLDQPGTGELIHPFLGSRVAVVESYSHGSSDGMGISQFKINFIEVKQDNRDLIDTKHEFQQLLKQFNQEIAFNVSKEISIRGLITEYHKKLENGVVGVLSTIERIKNALDYSEFVEKANSLLELTTNKNYWDDIIGFLDPLLSFKNHSPPIIHFYKKMLNHYREYLTDKDLIQEINYKKNLNLIKESIKYVAISKLTQLVIDGELSDIDKNYLIAKIRESKHDLIIPGTYELLNSLENFISDSIEEAESIKTEILGEIPALVAAYEHQLPFERLVKNVYNINKMRWL